MRLKTGLLFVTAVSALAMTATGALAGGFAVREQSALFQGLSFAGSAAGGSLSSMYLEFRSDGRTRRHEYGFELLVRNGRR